MIEENNIPNGWKIVELKSITDSIQYGYTESSSKEEVGPKFLRITDIQDNQVQWDEVPYCKIENEIKSKYLLKAGDLVFARTGATVGKSFLIKGDIPEAVFASYLIRVRVNLKMDERYLSYFFHSPNYWSQITEGQVGIGQPNVNGTKLGQLKITIAPLEQQQAIVSKIEELLSDLENGKLQLQIAQQQLKIYRQSLLKWAFEGKLTERWRKEQSKLLSGEKILQQIKHERSEFGKLNKITIKPIQNISEEEMNELPLLPKEMVWVRLGELLWSVKDGPHYSPKYQEKGIPFISGGNIRSYGIDFEKVKYISKELHEELSRRCKPEKWDVLYTKGGTTGIAKVNTYDVDFNVWVHVAVLKVVPSINPFYLQHVLNSNHCYKQSQKYTHGVGNQDLGLTRMILITLPICSIEEQDQIVKELESKLTVCDKIEETISQSLLQAESLRQSILKKAFEGKLVI